jgi:hypothetical protein
MAQRLRCPALTSLWAGLKGKAPQAAEIKEGLVYAGLYLPVTDLPVPGEHGRLYGCQPRRCLGV